MAEVRAAAVEHDDAVTAALTDEERAVLVGLLRRVAEQQGLRPGVHPSYRGTVITGSVQKRPDAAGNAPS